MKPQPDFIEHWIAGDYQSGHQIEGAVLAGPDPAAHGPLIAQSLPYPLALEGRGGGVEARLHPRGHGHDFKNGGWRVKPLRGPVHQRLARSGGELLPVLLGDGGNEDIGVEGGGASQGQHLPGVGVEGYDGSPFALQQLNRSLLQGAVEGGVDAAALASAPLGKDSDYVTLW